jgi:hypothetical protein
MPCMLAENVRAWIGLTLAGKNVIGLLPADICPRSNPPGAWTPGRPGNHGAWAGEI